MSEENVEIVRHGYEHFIATGELLAENVDPEFVWDMSTFDGWPEKQTYAGVEGTREFLNTWLEAWEDWEMTPEAFHDAGDKVVVVLHQSGRSKGAGMPVEMTFAQVWTIRDGKQLRMQMYTSPAEALSAVGLGNA
jgi:ketosteroid isomerase-like protein